MTTTNVTLTYKIRKSEVASTILPALKGTFESGEPFGDHQNGYNFFDLDQIKGWKVADFAMERHDGEFFLQIKFSSDLKKSVAGCKEYLALLRRFASKKNLWQTIIYREGSEVRVCSRERTNAIVKKTGEVRLVIPVTL